MDRFFGENEISELWITFPDPRPREGEEKKRLTSPRFLDMYESLVKKHSIIHLKTDNNDLFDYTLEILQQKDQVKILACTKDFNASEFCNEHFGIKTKYEKVFSEKGESIKYLKFHFQ